MVHLTDDEFQALFALLELANTYTTAEEGERLVGLEYDAWELVQEIRRRADPPA
jgi:hypothetical protein